VVLTVKVEVAGELPAMVAVGGESEHVGNPTVIAGVAVTAHVRAAVPENPLRDAAVIVETPIPPGSGIAMAGPVKVKLGVITCSPMV
jgi:hypothetical protein